MSGRAIDIRDDDSSSNGSKSADLSVLTAVSTHQSKQFSHENVFEGWRDSVFAAHLARPPKETRATLARADVSPDISVQKQRGEFALTLVRQEIKKLEETFDFQDPRIKEIVSASSDGDIDRLGNLGIDLDYLWADDIVRALLRGSPVVEIETVGPYAVHHMTEEGLQVRPTSLSPDERCGLRLAAMLRRVFQQADNMRIVSLFDDVTGVNLTHYESAHFISETARLFFENKVILPGDSPGKEFLLLRESAYESVVDDLINDLTTSPYGSIEHNNGQIIFRLTDSFIEQLALKSRNRRQELRKRGIALKIDGVPTCQAYDAATFLENPINKDCMHVIILDTTFAAEQDKTFALLRALDITTPENYNSAFFDSHLLSPDLVAYVFAKLIERNLETVLRDADYIDDWSKFDPDEYVERNYSRRILDEDRSIINFVIKYLNENFKSEKPRLVADVGAGPNLYPAMILAPYLADNGAIDLIEFTEENRAYLKSILLQQSQERLASPWSKFEELMINSGGSRYENCLEQACKNANVIEGSIFFLPKERYDIITSYFVSESITSSRRKFRLAIRSLASAVKPGGLLVIAHMLGSREYHAGVGTHFPSVFLDETELEKAYRDAGLQFEMHTVGDDISEKARDGYSGMAVVIAKPSSQAESLPSISKVG